MKVFLVSTLVLSSQLSACTSFAFHTSQSRPSILRSNVAIHKNAAVPASTIRRSRTIVVGATETESDVEELSRKETLQEASNALASVGWAPPLRDDELTSDDPFVQRIDAEIRRDIGVSLEELLNPAKVVNLERDLYNLRSELASLTGKGDNFDVLNLSTEECDGGDGGEAAQTIRDKIVKKERDLNVERRAVFRGWLKNVFLGQAVLSLGLSWVMVSDPSILLGGFDWYEGLRLEMPIKVLGFWWWWLFIVPSLRSRRPGGLEKKALDIAFLATPAISLIAPAATKDPELIWVANFVVVAASYAYAFLLADADDDADDEGKKQPAWLKFVYKALDFGTGQERGARK